jgi:hypothetical protein
VVDKDLAVFDVTHFPEWVEKAFRNGNLIVFHGSLQLFDHHSGFISAINPGGWVLNSHDHGIQLMDHDEFERRYKKVT